MSEWSERELSKQQQQLYDDRKAAQTEFDRLHTEGAEKFGMLWLSCNSALADLRDLPFLPEDDKRIDALLSMCAWIMAERETKIKESAT